tara:strand:- start:8684 stop:9370 length:687 start_codon:yes stop_codon:yes gene_type:complete
MNHYKQSYMAEYNLKTMSRNSKQMLNDLNRNRSLPDWAKSKLTEARSHLSDVADYKRGSMSVRPMPGLGNTGTTDRSQLYKTILLSGALVGGVYLYDKGIASKKRLKTLPEGAKVMDQKDKLKIATAFLASGMAFGLIDNGGLMLGMSAIEGEVAKYTTDEKVIAGLGNTYSDVLGSFLGAYVGSIIAKKTGWDGSAAPPLWAAAGVGIGCLIPVYLRYRSLKKQGIA